MFKKLVFLVSLLLAFFIVSGCAHMNKDMENTDASFSEIIVIPGKTKDDLFVKANSWMVDTFVKADSVVEYSDKQAGLIKGKYVTDTTDGMYLMRIKSVITIEVKDGKARVSLSNPMQKATGSMLGGAPYNNPYAPVESQQFFDEKVKPQFAEVVDSFKMSLQKTQSSW